MSCSRCEENLWVSLAVGEPSASRFYSTQIVPNSDWKAIRQRFPVRQPPHTIFLISILFHSVAFPISIYLSLSFHLILFSSEFEEKKSDLFL